MWQGQDRARPSTTANVVRYVVNALILMALLIVFLAVLGMYSRKVPDPVGMLIAAVQVLAVVAGAIGAVTTGGLVARKATDAASFYYGTTRTWQGQPITQPPALQQAEATPPGIEDADPPGADP